MPGEGLPSAEKANWAQYGYMPTKGDFTMPRFCCYIDETGVHVYSYDPGEVGTEDNYHLRKGHVYRLGFTTYPEAAAWGAANS